MIVDTRRLFIKLLRVLHINAVCDVGSMNGSDALAFHAALPAASIFAFEPNPENFRLMQRDPALRDQHIQLVPLAVTNYDGEAEFFVVKADYSTINDWRGMSSLHKRRMELALLSAIPVGAARLDTFLSDKLAPQLRLALWIDAEGKAYEVIEGAAGLVRSIEIVHVEVEGLPCIAPDQKMYEEVRGLLHSLGFVELATDAASSLHQFNAVFVRRSLSCAHWLQVSGYLAMARLRFSVATGARKIKSQWRKVGRK